MPRSLNDHEMKFWCDSSLYIALKHLAEADDRATGEYIRHVLKCHVRQLSEYDRRANSPELGMERAESGSQRDSRE